VLDSPHFPPGFDHFRVEWERAGWTNAGSAAGEERAKRDLLRWRLHLILGDLTGKLEHYYEAAAARPDLAPGRAALGCALARAGRAPAARSHLRPAVAANPFDLAAARALFQVLGDMGDSAAQRVLARDRRGLHTAAPRAVPAEDWFVKVPPVGDELASILILCCNELDYTRRCLQSVLRHTRQPYELVLVNNGSTDGTAEFLEELRGEAGRPGGPVRVEVIHNQTNRGFAAGCNQALALAAGRYLVFLNNDTVVSEAWLAGLIGGALHDWPHVGMVGPVTNYARPPQQIPVDYRQVDGLELFAARRRREYAGKAVVCPRLTGFCLLVRREVLDEIGGFDESYGQGFFEDDDLCVRAAAAGYKLVVAEDVFVHHFGSRTFRGQGVDCRKQLRENFERFKAKWGPDHAAGYSLPDPTGGEERVDAEAEPDVVVTGSGGPGGDRPAVGAFGGVGKRVPSAQALPDDSRPVVSLCMIVKNEEENLPHSLGSVAGLDLELIVVDTGSTDRTREIAAEFGAKVVDFRWVDSFAAARNEALRHATGRWVLWLDADDLLDADNREKLRRLIAQLGRQDVAYCMTCACPPDEETGTTTEVKHVRLFPNLPGLRWQFRVHEQILPGLRERGVEILFTDIVIQHTGYQDPALRRRKLERDLRLLDLERAEQPDHPFTLFNLAQIYDELKRPAQALPLLRRSLECSDPADSIVRKLYFLISQCQRRLGRPEEALATCADGRRLYPDDAELLFQEGVVRHQLGDLAGAEGCLLRLLESRDVPHFDSIDAGVRGYKTRHNLAIVYRAQGRDAEAEAHWRAALAEAPHFIPARVGLAELYLAHGRWAELEEIAAHLEEEPAGAAEGVTLRARAHMARQEWAGARRVLEDAVARTPGEVWLWVVLSECLLREGRDWPAAERVLRRILELDPDNRQAQGNLELLLRRRAA
jgi:GT2 family glycosyltransferase/Flp pilus assembly protein TadD